MHFHLSDDQGWRIEIKSWPKLTEIGGQTEVGGGEGGFYTQEDFREIVEYAADRFITIVPEIDLPGHTNAALASYEELNCNGKATALYTGIKVGFSTLCVTKKLPMSLWRMLSEKSVLCRPVHISILEAMNPMLPPKMILTVLWIALWPL